MASPIVELKNINFRRGDRVILRDVSWTIQTGQHWALLGANGSGKTTLLKIITGYEWPSAGSVSVLGGEYGKCLLQDIRKTIGWVSSTISTKVPHNDTAIEIVASGIEASMGLYRNFTEDEFARALAAMNMLSSAHFADQPYSTLSQGEQQRTLIARALVSKPKLLVLDEPCVGLDPAAKELFLGDIKNLLSQSAGPGIIFVTHHIDEIREWITDVLLLKDGQKLAAGQTSKVLTDRLLSEAFSCSCSVENKNGKYSMSVT
jgi:iron complex transport system ATP-binding protein